jgi:hypothetical protein
VAAAGSFPATETKKRFDELCRSIPAELKARNAVLDGELVALGKAGRPAFYDLMSRRNRIVYFAFDPLWLDGEDLRDLPLLEPRNGCAPSFHESLAASGMSVASRGSRRRSLSRLRHATLKGWWRRGEMANTHRRRSVQGVKSRLLTESRAGRIV